MIALQKSIGGLFMNKIKINKGWQFFKEGQDNIKQNIDLPHDAMIFEKRDPKLENGTATGFLPGGKYIYEKTIFGDSQFENKKLILEFEGVYMNCHVYLNGVSVGGRIYGYSNFFIDITDKLIVGKDNRLKVVVDNSKTPNSRWYSGSGIYRDVNLWIGEKKHISPEGLKIKTISIDPAFISISCEGEGLEDCDISYSICFDDKVVSEGSGLKTTIEIKDAKLWNDKEPNLYTLIAEVIKEGRVIDTAQTSFGIRILDWNAQEGFLVNGKTTKLKGGCIHHDHGILGACCYDKSEYRRIKKLKEMGYNTIRYSHNPSSKNFLEACDKLGMYVIDESFDQWKVPQSKFDYALYFDKEWKKDIYSLASKDYNHPSVIMYCVGNEITDTGLPFGGMLCKGICSYLKSLDDTRPTMIAINSMLSTLANLQAKKASERDKDEENVGSKEVNDIVALLPKLMASITPEGLEKIIGDCANSVDIVGYNYGQNLYEGTHILLPNRVILSSETFPKRMASNWKTVEENSYVIGDCHWTAWDYLGEAGVGMPVYGTSKAPFSKEYPCVNAGCGSFDLTGYPETAAYYTAILWDAYKKPFIAVRPVNHSGEEYALGNWRLTDSIPCWTWNGCEGKKADIEVYSIGDSIELFKNDVSLGKKKLENRRCLFKSEYLPGKLAAISYDENGKEIARTELKTADEETVLKVLPEENEVGFDDLVYVPIHLTDDEGTLKMALDKKITVEVTGEGKLLALGSAIPATEESYHTNSFTSWHGRVLAIIKSNSNKGNIHIKATSENLESASADIKVI